MKVLIEKTISRIVEETASRSDITTEWKRPLVGYAAANDPLFGRLKEVTSHIHIMPQELNPEAKTVISYFLPFEEWVPNSNYMGRASSKEWALGYIETNDMIQRINDALIELLQDAGYMTAKLPMDRNLNYELLMSPWSNRHIAYIAGLGTFGLNNMLITENGCCGRLGNVVTALELEPTLRTENENCIFKATGGCGVCVDRCIFGALTMDGFDRVRCHEVCSENKERYSALGHAEICGKCLTALPCSFFNPMK